jgi:hypothetical protein
MSRLVQVVLVLVVAGCCAAGYWLYKSAFDVILERKDVIFLKVKGEFSARVRDAIQLALLS